jgi:hypothetical protein
LLAPVGLVGRGCFAPIGWPRLVGLVGVGPDQLPRQIWGPVVSNMGANRGRVGIGGGLAPVYLIGPGLAPFDRPGRVGWLSGCLAGLGRFTRAIETGAQTVMLSLYFALIL